MSSLAIDHPVILFDGVCNLCEGFVKFVIERDPEATLRFAPLQSRPGEDLLTECGLEANPLEGVVLVDSDGCYRKSDAVIRTALHLGWPYKLLGPTRFLPRSLRDIMYDIVADRRYRWFGQKEECLMPTPDIQSRFLAGTPGVPQSDEEE